jgi:hypothetical protein
MTNAAPICARCRQAIAGPSRKDRFGNVYCEPCAQALIAASQRVQQRAVGLKSIHEHVAASSPRPQGASPMTASPAPQPAAATAAPPGPSTPASDRSADAPFIPDLTEPESSPADGTIALEPEDRKTKPRNRVCASCSKVVNADVYVCPYCNYDARFGPPAKLKTPLHTCRNCGYDLAGLPEPVCPECGTRNPRRSSRAHEYEEDSREVAKWAYLRPAIMLGTGLVGITLFGLLAQGNPLYAAYALIQYAVEVPIVLGVYIACCALWIGFDMPLRLIALRLAGIFAVVDLVGDIVGLFPVAIVSWSITGILYIWMLSQELELEYQDALIIAVLSFGASMLTVWLILEPIAKAMGVTI